MQTINRLKILPLYYLPKHFLTHLIFVLTRIEWSPWKNLLINTFTKVYKVDMSQARENDSAAYRSFNHFFTRELKPECRPINGKKAIITSPVDGAISQIGNITGQSVIQAKGHDYQLHTLLAGDNDMVTRFTNGNFATLYLSPRDYHRIHMPVTGCLERMIYVPGDLFPVNRASVSVVDGVFARNERVINYFNTELGKLALIMVGAMFVGSMESTWAGQITPTKDRYMFNHDYEAGKVNLEKGQEMGRFNMGSTVILLFEPDQMKWKNDLEEGTGIVMGEELGSLLKPLS
jgi:phosphatidylserine decarboxylase